MVFVDLPYLEHFASYLNGQFEHTQNRYQRGLNVVLKALCAPPEASDAENHAIALSVTLPIGGKDFTRKVQAFKESF